MFAAKHFYQLVSCLQNFESLTAFFYFILSLSFSVQAGRKGLWFHCCVGVSFPFHGDGRLMTDYCLNNSNWFCTWDLEMLNNVLWKSIQYYSKYGIGQISLLREFMKNQMLLPRFISLNSNNIQHKIIFCPMILNRILVRVLMGLTHCMNYHPDFSGNFCYVPDWG